jgi:omega-6 fatty acid desaturase (delta-12 desaturase)
LFDASRRFAREDPATSWYHLVTTLAALAAAIAIAAAVPWWPVRVPAAMVAGLLLVRVFTLYHDHMHGALLRRSRLARGLFTVLGLLMLTAPRVWNDTHNVHHANTARLNGSSLGTYVLWTVERWRSASRPERLLYRLERHPLNMVLGHLTVFFIGMCVLPFVKRPLRYASSGLAALLHVALATSIIWGFGFDVFLFAMLVPFFIACAIGSYLFFAQHNAEGVTHTDADSWEHVHSAVAGSTYLCTDAVTRWFSGNIGYHHVHHLNVRIPFYRLPEAMDAIVELQDPVVTTLHPRDVNACLRLALWDADRSRMVALSEVAPTASG